MAPHLDREGGRPIAPTPTPTPTPTHGQALDAPTQQQQPPANATVLRAASLSPTVRALVLKLDDADADGDEGDPFLDYKAGQWVDLSCDGFPGVGGFSMCAPPSGADFRRRRELELAVKRSRHPPAAWAHDPERCKPGARVRVRAGGSFTLGLADAAGCDAALFLAGGIGVTALAAMAGELSERWQRGAQGAGGGGAGNDGGGGGGGPRRAAVLYSARRREGLVLLPPLRRWAAAAPGGRLRLQLHVTGDERPLPADGREEAWRRGRMSAAEALAAVDALALSLAPAASSSATGGGGGRARPPPSVGVFVCGPPQMTDELAAAVAEHPLVGKARVFTEKWW